MEGTVQTSTADAGSNQSIATSESATPVSTNKGSSYNVSESEVLGDLGIDLKDGDDDGTFEFGNVSANPKVKADDAQDDDSSGDDLFNEKDSDKKETAPDDEDEWLNALKKDLDIDGPSDAPTIDETKAEQLLELERYGIKHKVPLSEAVKLAQQGYDYTQKTQDLAIERKQHDAKVQEFTASFEKQRQELQSTINEKEQLDYFFDYLKSNNPDLYQTLESEASQFKHQISNPFLEKLMSAQAKQLEEVNRKLSERENKEIRTSFHKELEEVKSMHAAKYARLGIKIDEAAIKKEWVDSGEPLIRIYKKLYADKILSLAQSKGALSMKAKANSNKAPTMGRVRSSAPAKPDMMKQAKKMSYTQLADALIKGKIR